MHADPVERVAILEVKGPGPPCRNIFFVLVVPKLPVSILKRNNRNKRLVSDSAETSFGSSFGCFDKKLVLEDTLLPQSSKLFINGHIDACAEKKLDRFYHL